jgi:aminopeptidase N
MTNSTLRLADYKTPAFEVINFELDFDLNETATRVTSKMKIKKLKDEPLVLDGENLELESLRLNQNAVQFDLTEKNLVIKNTPDRFELEIVTVIHPFANTSLDGLYLSKGLFTTQCESQGFRKITYFFDRPDVMTKYEVSISADRKKFPYLLSNGDLIESKDLGSGRHFAKWRDPFKKPSYLFALVAGDFGVLHDTFTTRSGKIVKLEIYGPHGQEPKCLHAMESLKKAMKWDEDKFDREYDLSTYMIVAIEDFNMGAMENKGLNVFNSSLIFADQKTATDQDFLSIEAVVAHEYFHNWTGNRITCRDWFHLSLKEGLTVYRDQEFSSDIQGQAVQRIQDVDSLRARQFPEDAGPNSHPVRPTEGASMDNFYSSTIYEKGAEVIRMMKNWVGEKTFKKAMDLYFEKYDGQAVTIEEFTACISEASGHDLTHFKLWYHQSGTPEIQVEEVFESSSNSFKVTLSQSTNPSRTQSEKKPLLIPFFYSLIDSQSGRVLKPVSSDISQNSDGQSLMILDQAQKTFTFKNLESKPAFSFNQNFSAPVTLNWKPDYQDLIHIIRFDYDGFNRREALYSLIFQSLDHMILDNKSTPDENLIGVYKSVIEDQSISAGLKAELLTFPSDSLILQRYENQPLKKIETAKNVLIQTIASDLKAAWKKLYTSLPLTTGISSTDMGIRSLENTSLFFWSLSEDAFAVSLLSEKSFLSPFMTNRLFCLKILIDRNLHFKSEALKIFKNQFETNSLMMNKWFQVQAASQSPDTFETVKGLVDHPLFDTKNPNKIYSLIRTFGSNAFQFFNNETEPYLWYAAQIKRIDKMNPQVAARLCDAYNLVPKLEATLQTKIKASLEALKESRLSSNVTELISRI